MLVTVFQLFVSSYLLLTYFVIPCFADKKHFQARKSFFVFDADKTILRCQENPTKCCSNQAGLTMWNWSRSQSYQHGRIDPHSIAWTSGSNTTNEFRLAKDQLKSDFKEIHLTTYASHPTRTDSRLTIKADVGEEIGNAKNLTALRDWLIKKNDIKDLESMFIILFDRDIQQYLYNVCYKQNYLEGLWVVKITDVRGLSEVETAEDHSRSFGFEFIQAQFKLDNLFCSHSENGLIPMDDVIDRFALPKSRASCGYDIKAPDQLYFALVIDVTLLKSVSDEQITTYLTEFLKVFLELSVPKVANPPAALLFLCYKEVDTDEKCSLIRRQIMKSFRDLSSYITGWFDSSSAFDVLVLSASGQDSQTNLPHLGLMTHLPQRTTVIVQVGGMVHSKSGDAPNICYLEPRLPTNLMKIRKVLKSPKKALSALLRRTSKKALSADAATANATVSTANTVTQNIKKKEPLAFGKVNPDAVDVRKNGVVKPTVEIKEKKEQKVKSAPLESIQLSSANPLKPTSDVFYKLVLELTKAKYQSLGEFTPAHIEEVKNHLKQKFVPFG